MMDQQLEKGRKLRDTVFGSTANEITVVMDIVKRYPMEDTKYPKDHHFMFDYTRIYILQYTRMNEATKNDCEYTKEKVKL